VCSERQENAATQGASLKAGININKSLTFLRQAIEKLARASKHQGRDVGSRGAGRHINMRNTQLTYLLQDSLGGNSKTTMLAAISPSARHANESLRTLEFALCASTVTTKFTVNEDPTKKQLTSLLAEIEHLKQQLKEQDSEELQKSLALKEEEIVSLKKEWDDKWGVVHHIFESSQLKLEAEKNGMVLDTGLPHLVTLNASRFDTGISIYFIPNEGRLEFGAMSHDSPPDVILHGPRVQKLHCTVVMNNGDVFLMPHSEACYLGNKQIFTKTQLTHGCAVVLGEVNMFRFNNPAEALELQQSADKDPVDATPLSGPLSYLELDFTKEKAALEARLETLQNKITSLEKDMKGIAIV
jgi:kinesin family protein 1